jgi:CRP-like cAMP-binding protein
MTMATCIARARNASAISAGANRNSLPPKSIAARGMSKKSDVASFFSHRDTAAPMYFGSSARPVVKHSTQHDSNGAVAEYSRHTLKQGINCRSKIVHARRQATQVQCVLSRYSQMVVDSDLCSGSRHTTFRYVIQMTNDTELNGNRLLSLLPPKELRALERYLEPTELPLAQVLHDAGEPITQVHFVTHGVVSLVKTLEGGETIEIATVGPEGLIGTTLGLGSESADHRAIIQVPGQALCMKASAFKKAVKDSPKLQNVLMRYTVALLNQVAQSAACNRAHTIDERCARWLLMTHDRVSGDMNN